MRKTEDKPNALRAATASGVLEMLQVANTNLEKIQKCLEVGGATVVFLFSSVHVICSIESLRMTIIDIQLSFFWSKKIYVFSITLNRGQVVFLYQKSHLYNQV